MSLRLQIYVKNGPKAFADAVRKHKGLLLTGKCDTPKY
jgi:hypothetical protein